MPDLETGSLYFSYKDRATVTKMKIDLKEEYDLLLSMRSTMNVLTIRVLRWLSAPVKDYKECPDDKRSVLKNHVSRHECHLGDNNNLYVLGYSVEGKISFKEYTTFALSEEQARGLLEDEIVRVLEIDVAPVIKKTKNYGPQPIGWCIDWTARMIDDVEKKDKAING